MIIAWQVAIVVSKINPEGVVFFIQYHYNTTPSGFIFEPVLFHDIL